MVEKNLNFEYIDDFTDDILDRIYADEDLCVSIVAKFDEMKEIVKTVVSSSDEVDFEKIDMTAPIINDYNAEYVMDVSMGSDGCVVFGVEPAKRNGKYLDLSNDEVYILENCDAKVTERCDKYSDMYIVHIGVEDKFEDDGEECMSPECKSKRDLSNDVLTDRIHYRVNGKSVSKDEYDKAYKDFHEFVYSI